MTIQQLMAVLISPALHKKYCSWMCLTVLMSSHPLPVTAAIVTSPLASHLYTGIFLSQNLNGILGKNIRRDLTGFNARDCFSQKSGIQD